MSFTIKVPPYPYLEERYMKWLNANTEYLDAIKTLQSQHAESDILIDYEIRSIAGSDHYYPVVTGTDAALIKEIEQIINRYYVPLTTAQ